MHLRLPTLAVSLLATAAIAPAQQSFVNWESPHVTPLAYDAAGSRLLVCNTPDGRLEILDVSGARPVPVMDVPVGIDPVSVRLHTPNEAWVVNSISDTISVVDLTVGAVVRTIDTEDEPADVVFAGTPLRAFVSCAQPSLVQVFDPAAPDAPLATLSIDAEEPRAMAVSPDGSTVYVAAFESGNGSTILGGGLDNSGTLILNNVVSDPMGPYGGQNPPPNDGANFVPAMAPGNPAPPAVGLIVKKDNQGRWMDDNGGNWTDLVSGPNAARSNRPQGWDVIDHDVVVIDAATLGVTYADRLMNINMAIAVHPVSGAVTVVGTDATNEVRFEPVLDGVFLRVQMASVDPGAGTSSVVDMNPHLDYTTSSVPQGMRDLSIGDPRGIAWSVDGSVAYVTGMGSNNLVPMAANGSRTGSPIEVGEGPTGVVLDAAGTRAYVLNKFEGSISVVDLGLGAEIERVHLHDASPEAIKVGRRHLYDTHANSGLGHVSCASCHVDAKTDRLAWDLGDPSAPMDPDTGQNLGMNLPGLNTGFEDFHPMKGPMTTQTMQDIIGKEPLHWRGDRDSLHDFSGAFVGLQGDDAPPSHAGIDEFEAFLATVAFPPNPFRNFDNSMPTSIPLPGLYSVGRFSPAGTPMPAGNPNNGLNRYTPPATLDGGLACATCHTLPTGMGPDMELSGFSYVPFPTGPEGEAHHGLVSVDGSTNVNIKIAQLRSVYKKVGMELTQTQSRAGFGYLHDGSIPSIVHFLSSPAFEFQGDQALANMVAFMLAFSGSDLPNGSATDLLFPPGSPSNDTHAGVGKQVTVTDFANAPQGTLDAIQAMFDEADLGRVGLVAHGIVGGIPRGATYLGGDSFQSDRMAQTLTSATLLGGASASEPVTLTVVPFGSEVRVGTDRDSDGFLDQDERDAGSDPANADSVPSIGTNYCGPAVPNASGASGVIMAVGSPVASDNDLRLLATSLPTASAGYFVASTTQAFSVGPGGSVGNLCIGGNVARFAAQVRPTGALGAFSVQIDLESVPTNPSPSQVMPGESWNFQAWFRDASGGAATSNFTDAIEIVFE